MVKSVLEKPRKPWNGATAPLDDALYIAGVAAHEAGHAIVASSLGCQLTSAQVNFDDGCGEVRYMFPRGAGELQATVIVSGAMAEAKLLGQRNWRQYLDGYSDYRQIAELAESAGVSTEQLIAVGARRAKPIIDSEWNSIRRLAKRLLESGGRLEFHHANGRLLHQNARYKPSDDEVPF